MDTYILVCCLATLLVSHSGAYTICRVTGRMNPAYCADLQAEAFLQDVVDSGLPLLGMYLACSSLCACWTYAQPLLHQAENIVSSKIKGSLKKTSNSWRSVAKLADANVGQQPAAHSHPAQTWNSSIEGQPNVLSTARDVACKLLVPCGQFVTLTTCTCTRSGLL